MARTHCHILCATLLVGIWLANPVLSAVHHLLEVHTYCAEHGTLEEVADSRAGEPTDDESGCSPAVRERDGGPPTFGHDACALQEFAPRDIFTPEVDCASARAAIAEATTTAPVMWTAGLPIPLLLVAPKSSPPYAT